MHGEGTFCGAKNLDNMWGFIDEYFYCNQKKSHGKHGRNAHFYLYMCYQMDTG